MWKNAFWKPLSIAANDVWVPVFAPADNNEGADDDADERDADSYSDPRHRLLVQMVEAIRKTWRGFKAGCTSASKRFEVESERPALSCELTSGEGGAARESVVAARGEVCSHRQLHHAGKRSVAHSVGRRNLHQVNVARLQVLQQSHGGGPCWDETRLWGFLPVRLSCNLRRRRQISLTINIKIPRSRVNSVNQFLVCALPARLLKHFWLLKPHTVHLQLNKTWHKPSPWIWKCICPFQKHINNHF